MIKVPELESEGERILGPPLADRFTLTGLASTCFMQLERPGKERIRSLKRSESPLYGPVQETAVAKSR